MAIDYSRLRALTARRLIKALKKDGFAEHSKKGSTRLFVHPDGRTSTIHLHSMNQTFAIVTLKSIVKRQAKWTESDLSRLGILK